ncbi:MAG: HAD-IIB family hydrolase [Mycoplasmoidaceae bacterium]
MNIKLFISDVDGTLISHNEENLHYISEDTILAINRLKDLGIYFSIATGRHYKDVISIIKKYKIKPLNPFYIIGMNGSQIYNYSDGVLMEEWFISEEQLPIVFNIYEKLLEKTDNNITAIFSCDYDNVKIMRVNSKSFDKVMNRIHKYENNKDILNYEIIDNFDNIKNIYKVCFSFNYPIGDGKDIINWLKLYSNEFEYVISGDNFIEVHSKNISKGKAVKKIKEWYKIKSDELVVIGDSGNDLSMFQETKYSVTRECAHEFVKENVNYVFDGGPSVFVKKTIDYFIK